MDNEGGQPKFGGAPAGATMQAQYMARTMKCYPVHESELETLSTLNAASTVFTSIGSACLAFAVGIATNAAFAETMTPVAQVATGLGAPVLAVIALVFYGLGIGASLRRRSLWDKIKREAVSLHASAG